ncbi:hypothetical protein FRB90_007312 [Tulasnella sp. 427]|nr:hypothetical protein FRB90_007312 [Tulasnella sp. 427]
MKSKLMRHILENNVFSLMQWKADHASRPLWINPEDATIILEGFSPIAEQVQDFLVAISEPISRHSFMHAPYSLYAVVSVGLDTDDILSLIKDRTMSYGKVKLVLKRKKYYVESADPNILQMLLADPVVSSARLTFDPMGQPATEHGRLLPKPACAGAIPPTDLRARHRADGMAVANPRSPREWFSSSSRENEDEYGGSMGIASNFGTLAVFVMSNDSGLCIGAFATDATDAFFRASSCCCFG